MLRSRRQTQSEAPVVSVTSAWESRSRDVVRRQRRYVVAMLLRVACFVGMLVLPLPLWGRMVLAAVAVVIPYVAVVVANVWSPSRSGMVVPDMPARRALPAVPQPPD